MNLHPYLTIEDKWANAPLLSPMARDFGVRIIQKAAMKRMMVFGPTSGLFGIGGLVVGLLGMRKRQLRLRSALPAGEPMLERAPMKLRAVSSSLLAAAVGLLSLTSAPACGSDDNGGSSTSSSGGSSGGSSSGGSSSSTSSTSSSSTSSSSTSSSGGTGTKALGEDCAQSSECKENKCVRFTDNSGQERGFCSRICTKAADCPETGWECNLSPYTACVPAK